MQAQPHPSSNRRLLVVVALVLGATPSWTRGHELSRLPDKAWDRDAAAHLLRRAAFGGTAEDVDRLHALGLTGAVDSLLDFRSTPYSPPEPPFDDDLKTAPDRRLMRMLDEEQRRQAFQERRRAERRAMIETRLWWIERMVESPRPLEEKLTLFWHGHFTSGFREVDRAWLLYEQNQFLRRYCLDSFRELALGATRNRAMLVYLNNARNTAQSPNENYARELLELFTLGVGHYGEGDVRAAARALTGWTLDDEGFVFRAREHDYGPKKFLGELGNWDGTDVIDIILRQQACSEHLARCLLQYFLTPDPQKPLVARFGAVLRNEKYNLRVGLRALLQSEAFYDPQYRACLIKSPVELVVGTARQLGLRIVDLPGTARAMGEMGQELFQPPNVKGWDGDRKWINTATLFHRYNALQPLIYGSDSARGAARAAMNDEEQLEAMNGATASSLARLGLRTQPPLDVLPMLKSRNLTEPAAIVDFLARTLLAAPLASEKKDALRRYLEGGRGGFDPAQRDADARVRTVVFLLCSTPEYQLY